MSYIILLHDGSTVKLLVESNAMPDIKYNPIRNEVAYGGGVYGSGSGLGTSLQIMILPADQFTVSEGDPITQEMLDGDVKEQFRWLYTHELNAKLDDLQRQIDELKGS